jgi:hypothetical protein
MEKRGGRSQGDAAHETGVVAAENGVLQDSAKADPLYQAQVDRGMKFYEIKINYKDQEEYEDLVLHEIKPFIEELEALNLIKGFHFIMHGTLDLRLWINSEDDLPLLDEKISARGLAAGPLKKWNGFPENSKEYKRYGPEGIEILVRSLEFNSRLAMSIFQYKNERGEELPEDADKIVDNLNHQIVHYFLIQQGIDNLQQIFFSIDDAKTWLETISGRKGMPSSGQKQKE